MTSTPSCPEGFAPDLELIDLASSNAGAFERYRIPALASLTNGDLLAVYDGRPSMDDLPSPIGLLSRRSTDGGTTWDAPEVVRQSPAPTGHGDPSIIVDRQTGEVFVFHASTVNASFWSGTTSADHDDPDVQHLDFSHSTDHGHSWTHHRITANLKAAHPDWAGMFASSGEGIQLRGGPHAGRLVQQYVVRINETNWAVSAYSDDHGDTWRTGEPVGPGADENKVAELADGRLLLVSRAAPHRLMAHSTDGGEHWSPLSPHPELPDASNNGTVIRAFPEASADDPRAHWLLHLNTASPAARYRLTVRLSTDDGVSWPHTRVLHAGSAGYGTLTALPAADGTRGGRYGVLYERDGYSHLSYTSFDLDWLRAPNSPIPDSPATSEADGLQVRAVLDAIHPEGERGFIGDRIQPWIEVLNTGSTVFTDLHLSAGAQTGPTLDRLDPCASHTWRNDSPAHVVTGEDVAAGHWSGRYRVTALADGRPVSAEVELAPVALW